MKQYRQTEFDMKRPRNPVGSTLNSCESHFNETTRLGHKDNGPEPDTVAEFLEWFKQKVGRLVTEEMDVPRDRSSWIQGDPRNAVKYITKASGALYVCLGQNTGVADLLGSRDSLRKAKLIIKSKVKLSKSQPCGFTTMICEICISSSHFIEEPHNFGVDGKMILTSCPTLTKIQQRELDSSCRTTYVRFAYAASRIVTPAVVIGQ
jgi:hypothetical protein